MAAGSGAAAVAALRDEGSPRVDLAVEADPARIEEAIVARHRPDDSELREMDRTIEQMRAWRAEREAWLRSAEVRVTVGVVRTALGPRLLDPRASLPETLAQAAMAAAEGEDGAAAPEAAAEPEEEAPSWVGETTANSAELALEHAVQEFRRSQREADARVPLSEAQRARIDALLRPADDEDEVNALLAAAADDPDLRRRREEAAKLESEIVVRARIDPKRLARRRTEGGRRGKIFDVSGVAPCFPFEPTTSWWCRS